jgi:uncharacterized membrane protein
MQPIKLGKLSRSRVAQRHSAAQGRLVKGHPDQPSNIIGQSFTAVQGPVPSAAEAKLWADLLPSAPERFLQLAEKEQSHSQGLDKAQLQHANLYVSRVLRRHDRGQLFGMFLMVCIVGISVYALSQGQQIVAGIAVGALIGTGAISLIAGRAVEKRDQPNSK